MFTSKGHDLFATVGGSLRQDNDSRTVDRLWNPFVAAWYSGKDDPNLRLLRFDPGTAEIWQNASSLLAGIKMLSGINPQLEFNDDVAKVRGQTTSSHSFHSFACRHPDMYSTGGLGLDSETQARANA
jgi:hypothetical protein